MGIEHLRSLHDYTRWLEIQLDRSGAQLDRPYLEWNFPFGDDEDRPSRLFVAEHRLAFAGGATLTFRMTINDDLVPVFYNYDFRDSETRLVFRKDKHPGHEKQLGQLEHIHFDPKDESNRAKFEEVHLDEVIDQIWTWLEVGQLVGS